MRHSPPSAAQSGRVSRSRAMPVGGPHRENWPALQAVRVASSVGGTCRDGSHPDDWGMRRRGPAGRCADRRSAFPCLPGHLSQWGPRRDGSHPAGWGFGRRGPAGRGADRRSAFPCLPGHLSQWGPRRDGSHPAGWGFGRRGAARRCAGRRPALQPSSRLFSVCGARHSRWQDGASSARVSRSRAMPVGDRRSSRPRACSPSAVRGTHAGRMERHRRGFRAPARCRSETGAPGRARACSRSVVRGTHAGGMERHRRGFRASARCRSETGAPGRARACSRSVVRGTHGGGMERYRYWFRAPARCRSEDRRSWRRAALTVAGGNVIGAGFALPRDAGLKTGAPGGGLYQMEAGGPGRRPLGGVPAESSTPVGERTALPADRRRWRSPAVPRRSCSSRWSRCSGRSSRGSTG